MKLATFNVANMFERPAVMNLPEWSDGKGVLQDFFELNDLIQKASDTTANQNRMLKLALKRSTSRAHLSSPRSR